MRPHPVIELVQIFQTSSSMIGVLLDSKIHFLHVLRSQASALTTPACAAANVKVSMGTVGDCYDNAMAESLFATLETKLIDRQPRHRFRTRAQANREVFSYLEGFYNLLRIHSALDYRTPVAYERRYALELGSTANPKMNCPSNRGNFKLAYIF